MLKDVNADFPVGITKKLSSQKWKV